MTAIRHDDACILCEHYQKQAAERESENTREHEAIWKYISDTVSWRTFSMILGAAAIFICWIAIDHIGISRTVSANTKIIESNTSAIKVFYENQKVFYQNQAEIMRYWGLKPEPMPDMPQK